MRRIKIGYMATIVGIAVLMLAVASGILYSERQSRQSPAMNTDSTKLKGFDSQVWKAQFKKYDHEDFYNPRVGMVPALRREVLRKGLSREEVRELLGPPEQVRHHNIEVYDLGMSPFGFDYEYYFIEYDEEDKVVDFYLQRG